MHICQPRSISIYYVADLHLQNYGTKKRSLQYCLQNEDYYTFRIVSEEYAVSRILVSNPIV